MIGQAQTGTGKTAAFGFANASKIDPSKKAYKDLSSHQLVNLRFKHKKIVPSRTRQKIRVQAVYGGQTLTVKSAN